MNALLQHSQSRNVSNRQQDDTIFKKIQKPDVYKPLVIMIAFFAFQQFAGIFVVIVYGVKFAQSAGVSIDPFLCVVFIGVIRVIACLIVGYIMDKWGRRLPSMYSALLMTFSMYGLAIYKMYPMETLNWLPLFLILAYIFTSTLGLLTIPFSMIAEIYPQKIRGFASGITICAAYTMCFIIIKLYPLMVEHLGSIFTFIFFGSMSLVSIAYVYWFLPETNGKTLQEIEELFIKKNDKLNGNMENEKIHINNNNNDIELQNK